MAGAAEHGGHVGDGGSSCYSIAAIEETGKRGQSATAKGVPN